MKISVDAGALCVGENLRFGNYYFSKSLLEAIQMYDRINEYFIYSFCQKPIWLKESKKLHYKILRPKMLWLSTRVSLEEVRQKKDIFLALNQAIPISTSSQVISFSHGLSFYFYPQFYPDSYYSLKDQLAPMIDKSRHIVVSSIRVKTELKKLFPHFKDFVVINYGVPFDMLSQQAKVPPSSRLRRAGDKKYFLSVGMNNSIKNIEFLLMVFKQFRKKNRFSEYKLFLIGNLNNFEDKKNNIFSYSSINRVQLRKLYAEATAYLTTSYYESFNFPVLEALSQSCTVIGLKGAIIPEFREFVSLAYDSDDFLEQMKDIAVGKKAIVRRSDVMNRFSWKKYILKLKKLYK